MGKRILILADESADWKVAGLRQLDRLALEANDFATKQGGHVQVCIFWRPDLPMSRRVYPQGSGLHRADDAKPFDLILTTRLFLHRGAMGKLLDRITPAVTPLPGADETQIWRAAFERCEAAFRSARLPNDEKSDWEYLEDCGALAGCERRFLRAAGKSQDGPVSRWLNRPISRTITRVLLKFPITPNAWTLTIMFLPLAGCWNLVRGGYFGFLLGMLLYQLYSVLDGCDGEIARAKYLESEQGRRLDTGCDVVASLLMVVSLGLGLSRSPELAFVSPRFYLIEGFAAAFLMGVHEMILWTRKIAPEPEPATLRGALYARHREMVNRSGLKFLGENVAWTVLQLTKRDTALLVFLLLAAVGQPQWILHLTAGFALLSLILSASTLVAPRAQPPDLASSRAP